jgi:MFS family permease
LDTNPPPTPPDAERPARVRWLIFVLACAVSWLLYLHRYAWGVVKPFLLQENPDLKAHVGWLDGAFNATYAFGQVPSGLAGDLFGPRAALPALVLLWSAAGAAVAWLSGFWPLFGARVAFGLTQAGGYPVLNKVTRNWFPLASRTSVQGFVIALGRVGAACSPLIVASLLMGLLGCSWQTALVVIAMPGVLLAVLLGLLVRTSSKQHPWSNQAEQDLIEGGPKAAPADRGQLLVGNRAALFSLAMMLLYAFLSTFQDQLYVNWIPTFLVEGRGLDAGRMGLLTPLPLLGGAAGGVFGGWLNDALLKRGWPRRWVRSGVALTGRVLAAGLVMLTVFIPDGGLAMVVLLLARVLADWGVPTQWGAITDMAGRASGTVFGIVNTVGAVGGFVAGPALGYLKLYYGWEGLFFGVMCMLLLSALTWLGIDCTRKLVSD